MTITTSVRASGLHSDGGSLQMKKIICFLCVISLSFAAFADLRAFAAEKPDKKTAVREDSKSREDSPYILGPQNLIQIKVFGEADTNQIYRVDEEGYIKHSLLGRVKVGGYTVEEIERNLEKKLDGDYILNPHVTVFVLEFSHFSIIGEVRKPGNYELSGKISIIRAISIAGGFTPVADQRSVKIMRKNGNGGESSISVDTTRITQRGDISAEVYLQADDVIVIPKSFF